MLKLGWRIFKNLQILTITFCLDFAAQLIFFNFFRVTLLFSTYSMNFSSHPAHIWQIFHKNRAVTNCIASVHGRDRPSFKTWSLRWEIYNFCSPWVRKVVSQNIFNRKGEINFLSVKIHWRSTLVTLQYSNSSESESGLVKYTILWSRVFKEHAPDSWQAAPRQACWSIDLF